MDFADHLTSGEFIKVELAIVSACKPHFSRRCFQSWGMWPRPMAE